MIQENINTKFHSLGVLLLLDVPQGLQFGIDNMIWKVGCKFKGIKLIPLGTHFITYTLASENNMFKICKFMIFTQPNRIQVYRWNQHYQLFLQVKGQEGQGYKNGVSQYHFDCHLGPYPEENYSFWQQNTKYITRQVLDKLDPIQKMQNFTQQYSKQKIQQKIQKLNLDEQSDNQQKQQQEESQQQKQNPGKFKDLTDTIYYSNIPRVLVGDSAQITRNNMDKTPILKYVLAKQWKNNYFHLLGQLQYSFIQFVIGQSQQSLSQWKKLIDLFVNSQETFYTIQSQTKIDLQKFIMQFIPVFYNQLNQFPQDFFRDQLSKGNFLCQIFKRLKQYQSQQDYSMKIKKRLQKLFMLIQKKFKWVVDLQQQQDQLPTVVQLNQKYF